MLLAVLVTSLIIFCIAGCGQDHRRNSSALKNEGNNTLPGQFEQCGAHQGGHLGHEGRGRGRGRGSTGGHGFQGHKTTF